MQAGSFPCLHAKAIDAIHLLPVVIQLCEDYSDGSLHHRMRLGSLNALQDSMQIVRQGGDFLDAGEVAGFREGVNKFLMCYNWLANFHASNGRMVFHFVIKHHMLDEVARQCDWINPKAVWCFDFEHFIGKVKRPVVVCMAGSPAQIVGNKVAENYFL